MKKILLVVLLILGVFVGIWENEDFQRKYIYPLPEKENILYYSEYYNVDPYLISAVIMAESKFNVNSKSDRGAVGLMQIMPETSKWIAKEMEDFSYKEEKMLDPELNIKYGTWYLRELQEEFHNNEVLVLAAYNAGRGNVHDWFLKYNWDYTFKNVDEIPYEETKNYVKRVMLNKREYEKLYRLK